MFFRTERPVDRATIDRLYRLILDRVPEDNLVIEEFQRRGSVIAVVEALLSSPEFLHKKTRAIDKLFDGYHQEDISLLERHRQRSAPEPGFVKDVVGTRMRISHADFTSKLGGQVFDDPTLSDYRAEAVEYIGALRAVENAGSRFVMAELGAGWGPWIATCGVAAKRLGKSVKLYGLEADEGKIAAGRQHLDDNGFTPDEFVFVNAIVGAVDGQAYFPIIDSVGNWGGEAVWEQPLSMEWMQEVHCAKMATALSEEAAIDLVHMDIQGEEYNAALASFDFMTERVRCALVATHSRSVEGKLLDLFSGGGWHLRNDQPARCVYEDGRSRIIVDGTQVWENPRLRL